VEKATISQLKNHLSAYLKKVRAGRTVLIVDRDEPVARLERIEAGGAADDRLGRLEKSGLLRRSTRRLDLKALRASPPRAAESVLEALLDERQEGR
jgi:antitoxin (DNA-binding transcriptional repressor) of toxin-antitoxin stability system